MITRFLAGSFVVFGCLLLSGCTSPLGGGNDNGSLADGPHFTLDRSQWSPLPPVSSAIATNENSARAAQLISAQTMPRIDRHISWPELRLFQVLFGEAFELAHAHRLWSPHLGLHPPDAAPASLPARDFYLYVLAGVVEKSPSLAWLDPRAGGDDGAELVHPDTGEPGARLTVNLLGFDDERSVARAEISVVEISGRETGRTVDGRWNGRDWHLTLHPMTWTR